MMYYLYHFYYQYISHHDTHFTPTLLTSPPHTNYNTHFPHITNTLKHNTHTQTT